MVAFGLGLLAAIVLQAAVSDPVVASTSSCDYSREAVTYRPQGPVLPPSGQARFVPCDYRTGASAMEPTFAFTRSGAILFETWTTRPDTVGGVPPVSGVLRSRDGGQSWTDVTPRLGPGRAHPQSFDPYLIVDRSTGRAFTVDDAGDGLALCGAISYSNDEGDHWTTSPLACGGFDGESIAAGPPVSSVPIGYPNLVYYCTGITLGSSPPATTPACSKSVDGGLTFSPTGEPPFPLADEEAQGDVYGPWAGNPVVAADGTLYVPKRFRGQPQLAISRDEGLSWNDVAVARNGSASQANHAELDALGNVYYTWIGGDHLPYVAVSRDRGQTFGSPIRISPTGVREASIPKIAVDRPGRVAVAYLASVNAPAVPPWYAPCNVHLSECSDGAYAGARWNGYVTLIEGLLDRKPLLHTATAKPEQSPLLVGGCAAEGQCKAVLDYVDVHFDRLRAAWAAFVDDCRLKRQFTPVFNVDAPRCEDGVGEGLLTTLRPVK